MLQFIQQRLREFGILFREGRPLPNGFQVHLSNGGVLNVFSNGNFNIQGWNVGDTYAALNDEIGPVEGTLERKEIKRKVIHQWRLGLRVRL